MENETFWAEQQERLLEIIREYGIRDQRVLEAIRRVPRHRMVPPDYQSHAYRDMALPIGEGQTISQPSLVARMTELLALRGDEQVLEIGTGSGYQAAILAYLCQKVVTVERNAVLTLRAFQLLTELGIRNVYYVIGDGTAGFAPLAPYDGILVTASAPQLPAPLLQQLSPNGGRMVIPIGSRRCQLLTLITKQQDKVFQRPYGECVFVPLIGKYGWEEVEDAEGGGDFNQL